MSELVMVILALIGGIVLVGVFMIGLYTVVKFTIDALEKINE